MRCNRFQKLLLTASLLATVSCSADLATSPPDNDLTNLVTALGFSANGMKDHGSYVLVEGDIRLEKAILLHGLAPIQSSSGGIRPPATGVYQYSTTTTVSPAYVRQIRVDLNNINFVSNWASAVRTVMAAYNASGSRIYMYEASPGDITFGSVASAGYIASASFPYEGSPAGKPGPTITVNEQTNNTYTVDQKEWVMAHELGHTLGLRHDDAPDVDMPSEIGAHFISGTLEEDPNSVMLAGFDGRNWAGFNQYDLIALRALYPVMSVTVSGPFSIARYQSAQYTAATAAGISPITFQWRVRHRTTSGFWGTWSPWSSPSAQNYTYTSVNSCGIDAADLAVMATDSASWAANNNILISVSNPC